MAVGVKESGNRLCVVLTWDKAVVNGEVVQLYCVNPENGDVSQSGLSKNDGSGQVSYPPGYSGTTEVTVYDNDGNADFGVITVGEGGEVAPPDPDAHPEHPIVLPPDSDLKPEHPIVLPPEGEGGDAHPEHPIVIPPDKWPSHPIELPPEEWLIPSHPIVVPPDLGDDFWTGNLPEWIHPEPVE